MINFYPNAGVQSVPTAYLAKAREAESHSKSFDGALSKAKEGAKEAPLVHSLKPCRYFDMADESGCVNYRGVVFQCDRVRNRLTLGDVSNERNCIKVGLSGGGSLVFNRDSVDGVLEALTMFSKEEQDRILAAIEQDKLVRHAYNKSRQEETDDILDMGKKKDDPVKDSLSEEEEGYVKNSEQTAAEGQVQM